MKINYKKEYDDNSTFEFNFVGEEKRNSNIDIDNIKNLINNYLNKDSFKNNMVKNVTILRTILRDFDERVLILNYEKKNNTIRIKFYNGNIVESEYKNDEYSFKYFSNCESNYIFKNYNTKKIDDNYLKNTSNIILKRLNEIYQLNNIKPIVLNDSDKLLIEIYNLFYNEDHNFVDEDINMKYQTMMSILYEFNVYLKHYSNFALLDYYPINLELDYFTNKLYPLGKINNKYNNISEKEKKIISIVGNTIRNYIENTSDKKEALKSISKTLYNANYNLSSISNFDDTQKLENNLSKVDGNNIKLLKKINCIIKKENSN